MEAFVMRKLARGFVLVVFVVGSLTVFAVGCGGESKTPLQEAEAEYKEARDEIEDIEKGQEKKRNEALKAGSESEKLLNAQRDAVVAGDMDTYRELQSEVKEARAKSEALYREAEALPENAALEARREHAAHRIEGLKGCDKDCQKERALALKLNSKCFFILIRNEASADQATRLCDKRYPIPHYNILHLEGE